ncbi:MAG: molybdate ABC transporter permease subunit [Planctomycetes bacterium]|nr:molybdate ABC transporter permease subunit [Planctomycetota bacterium]
MRASGRGLDLVRRALVLVAVAFLLLPLLGLLGRAPWGEVLAAVRRPEVVEALLLSLRCSLAATALAALLGLPLAFWLAGPGSLTRQLVRILVTLPMVLPPVVSGVALLLAFGRNGLVGGFLVESFGFGLPFTSWGVIVAECYVALPFFVLTAEGGLRARDRRPEEAAATLGARPVTIVARITLPALLPTLSAALLVSWARALGEFGATITFAGNLAGSTRTMPLAVYAALETGPETAIALSLVLVAVSAGILVLMRKHWFPIR